jgi:hypothetical protein
MIRTTTEQYSQMLDQKLLRYKQLQGLHTRPDNQEQQLVNRLRLEEIVMSQKKDAAEVQAVIDELKRKTGLNDINITVDQQAAKIAEQQREIVKANTISAQRMNELEESHRREIEACVIREQDPICVIEYQANIIEEQACFIKEQDAALEAFKVDLGAEALEILLEENETMQAKIA